MFWTKNQKLFIATASKDIYAPMILTHMDFSTQRPSPAFKVDRCEHDFQFVERKQIRRGDEPESEIYQCRFCEATDVRH